MTLCQIIDGKEAVVFGDENIEVKGLSHDTRETKEGDMFFCLKGENVDGHEKAHEAIQKGAKVIVSEKRLNVPEGIANVIVGSTRRAMAEFASMFFGNPSKDMTTIMVTGTNGKTTTTYFLKKIFEEANKKVGVVGTNGVFFGGKNYHTGMTTPDPISLQNILRDMKNDGVQVVLMEMSAHALFYQKNWGVMSDISIFSNLTQDHLDFFSTMEKYGEAKKLLFDSKHSKFAVLNSDDDFSKKIIDGINIPFLTYGKRADADYYATNIVSNFGVQNFDVVFKNKSVQFEINMSGLFNVSNALSAIVATHVCGVDFETIKRGIKALEYVPGRFNCYSRHGKNFVIDYAHSPDGLVNILSSTRELLKQGGKLISVFGCGGNRDKTKRPLMGQISTTLADLSIFTSDNPRLEDPLDIIADIETGAIGGSNFVIEPNRKDAIALAFAYATDKDIIVISGKGAEDYIDQNGEKTHYSDEETINEL